MLSGSAVNALDLSEVNSGGDSKILGIASSSCWVFARFIVSSGEEVVASRSLLGVIGACWVEERGAEGR
jgi:hypothetical protein